MDTSGHGTQSWDSGESPNYFRHFGLDQDRGRERLIDEAVRRVKARDGRIDMIGFTPDGPWRVCPHHAADIRDEFFRMVSL